MLDDLTTTCSSALRDWTSWQPWLRCLSAAGLAYISSRGVWGLVKDTSKLTYFSARLLLRTGMAFHRWYRSPSQASQLAELREQLADLHLVLSDRARPRRPTAGEEDPRHGGNAD